MNHRFLKLSPGYFFLWLILWLIVGSKVYLLREATATDLYQLLIFGAAMLLLSYLGGWTVWTLSRKDQRKGEFSYLVILTLLFLGRTILLYREALAAM